MKILIAASEMVPFAKTGGLADVVGSLPKALHRLGHDVRVVIPNYKQISHARYLTDLPVPMDGHLETAIIRETSVPVGDSEVPVYLVDNYKYFYRDHMYGHSDEGNRFNFFCKGVLAMLPYLHFQPDVIQCNDWHTALLPLFLKVRFMEEPFYRPIASVFTVHNLQYQGRYSPSILSQLGLEDKYFTPEELEFYGEVNFMKAGLLYGDVINTVSPKYAMEIQTKELGEGLDGLLRKRSLDLYGIINGIDYDEFNPATDKRIYENYDRDTLERKKHNKYGLQKELNLQVGDMPLFGLISRLVGQKGLDLVAEIIEEVIHTGAQFVLLGTGEDYYQNLFADLKVRHPEQVSINLGFDAALAQKIYAGADMFLMPSRFEPCGLGQLISLAYGTIPIVRSTGGLSDTIIDYDSQTDQGNGFAFTNYSPLALLNTINRAIHLFKKDQEAWGRLMRQGMAMDFSWNQSAVKYVNLFEKAIYKRKQHSRAI